MAAATGLGVREVFRGKNMACWSLRIPDRRLGAFRGIVVTDSGTILSKVGVDGRDREREMLFREPDLNKVDADMGLDPVYSFLVERGLRGAGHDCPVGPVVNRQDGTVLTEGPHRGKVLAVFDNKAEIFLPQNWPPPGTGWPERPQHIHGLMAGMRLKMTPLVRGDNDLGIELTGEIPSSVWPSTLSIKHRIRLSYGAITRTMIVKNIGTSEAPFAFASHPDWLVPEEQDRCGVQLGLPALYSVAVDKNLHPNLSCNPFIKVTDPQNPLFRRFTSRDESRLFYLGETFIDNCFTGLPKAPVFNILFPSAGYGIQVRPDRYSTPGLINAFQVFAPLWKPNGAFREIALELQTGAACPFDPEWETYREGSPFFWHSGDSGLRFLGSGMAVLRPGQEVTWQVEEKIIPLGR